MNIKKIAWLCTSAEPGCDGVGDYTRFLAEELAGGEIQMLVIALNDANTDYIVEETGEDSSVLRLPAMLPWTKRWQAAEGALQRFDPDWVSLQFVCYGFHPKGLPYRLGEKLQPLVRGRKRHLMLHELWIGEAADYSLKDRLVGWLQKRIVLGVIRAFAPHVMHTSNPVYAAMLARSGQSAAVLPLFGNVPVEGNLGEEWFYEQLHAHGIAISASNRHEFWIAGLFGTIHPQWSPGALIEHIETLARKQQKRPVFVALGRSGTAGEVLWARLAKEYANASFVHIGDQPANRISQCLQNLDFGISPSPWALIGKSGTVAAMLDHGLPVVVGRDDWRLRRHPLPSPASHPLLFRADNFFAAVQGGHFTRHPASPSLPSVAAQFRRDLCLENKDAFSERAMATVGSAPGDQ